jgi:cytochrome P450
MLENTDASDLETEDLIKDLAGMVYLAGSDTTVATVISFFLAMVIHPEAQHRAQAELDTVVGRDRLPEFSDKKDLPYVNALMNECLRWLPVIPMGMFFFISVHRHSGRPADLSPNRRSALGSRRRRV